MHQDLLSLSKDILLKKGMKRSRSAEHLRCHSFPSCNCIILLSPITSGQSSSSSQQFIHHCWADRFISQKFILVYRQILSSRSVIHPLSLDKIFHQSPTISSISFPSSWMFHSSPAISFLQAHTFKPAHNLSQADPDCVWAWQIICDGPKLVLSRTINSYTFISSWCQYLWAQFLCLGC